MNRATTIKRDVMPAWFRQAIRHHYPVDRASGDVTPFGSMPHSWVDHWGTWELGEYGEAFVSEPYSLTREQIEQAFDVADRIGSRVYITGGGEWHEDTLRVVFPEPERGDDRGNHD